MEIAISLNKLVRRSRSLQADGTYSIYEFEEDWNMGSLSHDIIVKVDKPLLKRMRQVVTEYEWLQEKLHKLSKTEELSARLYKKGLRS